MGYAATLKKFQEQEDAAPQHTGCRAYGCPFPAAMSAGGGAPGYCRHHDGVNPVRWPGITEAMQRDYGPLTAEVLGSRRYFASGLPGDDNQRMAEAWARLQPHGYDMDPADCVHRNGQRQPARTYRRWSYAAEDLLARLVRGVK